MKYSCSILKIKVITVIVMLTATFSISATPVYYEGTVTSVELTGDLLSFWNVDLENLTIGSKVSGILEINEENLFKAPISSAGEVSGGYQGLGSNPTTSFINSSISDFTDSNHDAISFSTGVIDKFSITDQSIEFNTQFAERRFITLQAESPSQNFITSGFYEDLKFELSEPDIFGGGQIGYNFLNDFDNSGFLSRPRVNNLDIGFDLTRLQFGSNMISVSSPPIDMIFIFGMTGLVLLRKIFLV